VLTENGDVLVVAEKYADRPRAWKLPGGFVKPGSSLSTSVALFSLFLMHNERIYQFIRARSTL
jgi:hypothetical protein